MLIIQIIKERSIRLNYSGPDSTALVWFLGLTF